MDPLLHLCARSAYLPQPDIPSQYNNQLNQQLTRADNSNFLHVCAQFHDNAPFVSRFFDLQTSQVKRSMLTQQNTLGETPLHVATRNVRYDLLQLLIQQMVSLDEVVQVGSGDKIVKEIIRAVDKEGDTVVHIAVRKNLKNVVSSFLRMDVDFEHPMNHMEETPMYLAIVRGWYDIVDEILQSRASLDYRGPNGKTVLHAAVDSGYLACVSRILGKYPSLTTEADNLGWIPLHYAAYNRYVPGLVTTLLNADQSTAYITTTTKDHQDHNHMAAIHLATCQRAMERMVEILLVCPDSWSLVTSKGQNVLHLAVENERAERVMSQDFRYVVRPLNRPEYTLNFILSQYWAINLINQKDAQGNTPLHLYLTIDFDKYSIRSPLLSNSAVDWEAINKDNITPLRLLFKERIDRHGNPFTPYHRLFTAEYFEEEFSETMKYIGQMLQQYNKVKSRETEEQMVVTARNSHEVEQQRLIEEQQRGIEEQQRKKEEEERRKEEKKRRLVELRKKAETHLLVATLIATVTFTAGFTLPGGYDGTVGATQGMAVLTSKTSFKMFVIADTISVVSSIVAVFLHFTSSSIDDDDKLYKRYVIALLLIIIAMITMVIAFVMGLYAVLNASSSSAISICVLGSITIPVFGYMLLRDAPFLFA